MKMEVRKGGQGVIEGYWYLSMGHGGV